MGEVVIMSLVSVFPLPLLLPCQCSGSAFIGLAHIVDVSSQCDPSVHSWAVLGLL